MIEKITPIQTKLEIKARIKKYFLSLEQEELLSVRNWSFIAGSIPNYTSS